MMKNNAKLIVKMIVGTIGGGAAGVLIHILLSSQYSAITIKNAIATLLPVLLSPNFAILFRILIREKIKKNRIILAKLIFGAISCLIICFPVVYLLSMNILSSLAMTIICFGMFLLFTTMQFKNNRDRKRMNA